MTDFSFVDRLPETISTERLILRAPELQDADTMAHLANNNKIYKMLARLPHPYTRDHAVDFIENGARAPDEHAFAVVTRDENFIGIMGLHVITQGVEIGYWLGEPYWGEGYASEAAIALADAAEAAGCTELYSSAKTENLASLRVLEKCGFVKTSAKIGDCGPHKGVSITYLKRERSR